MDATAISIENTGVTSDTAATYDVLPSCPMKNISAML